MWRGPKFERMIDYEIGAAKEPVDGLLTTSSGDLRVRFAPLLVVLLVAVGRSSKYSEFRPLKVCVIVSVVYERLFQGTNQIAYNLTVPVI
jgi:hypothetical protein